MENTEILKNWFQNRSDASFEKLYEVYKPVVYRYIYNLAPNLEEFVVADIVQDVFLELYSKAHSLKNINKFKSWLYSISKFVLYRYYRKENQFNKRIDKEKQRQMRNFSIESPVEKESEKFYLKTVILEFQETLKPIQREMFYLRFFEGEKYDVIAKICHCSVRKVKYNIQHIFNAFQQIIKEKGLSV